MRFRTEAALVPETAAIKLMFNNKSLQTEFYHIIICNMNSRGIYFLGVTLLASLLGVSCFDTTQSNQQKATNDQAQVLTNEVGTGNSSKPISEVKPWPSPFPIHLIKRVPAAIRAKLPRRARTVFFGVAPIGTNHSAIFLHAYTVPNRKVSDEMPYPRLESLDLLQRQVFTKGGKRGKHWESFRRLNRIDLMGDETSGCGSGDDTSPFPLFDVLWLQPKEQRGPILVFGGPYDEFWSELFIAFPEGLKGKPSFLVCGGADSLSSDQNTVYNGVDKRGYMVFTIDRGDISGQRSSTRYSWAAKGFVGHESDYHQ